MMEIVITGGGGFIGSHLADALLTRGEKVIAIDIEKNIPQRLSHLSNWKNFQYVATDIRDKQKLDEITPKKCQKIFHLAAIVGVRNYCDDPLKTIDVNIGGLRNIIDIALLRNSKIIFASTSEIYGKNSNVPWAKDSDRVLSPTSVDRWSYSSSKAVCEHMLFATYRRCSLPMVIIRLFNVYGPRQSTTFAIPAMICNALNGRDPNVYNLGEQTRCFTFVDDAIEGILKASENPMAEGEAFNIGSTYEVKIVKLARMIIDIIGKSNELKPKFINPKETYGPYYEDLSRRIPDVKKAQKILSWEARTDLGVGLRKTVEFFRAQINQEQVK